MADKGRTGEGVFDSAGRSSAYDEQVVVRPAIACFELRSLSAPNRVAPIFAIQLSVRPDTYPFVVVGGTISGEICSTIGMRWAVTEGSFGTELALHAELTPLAVVIAERVAVLGDCASKTIDISGVFQGPDSYAGPYGFDNASYEFSHVTLFKGWQACSL
jgi:hypothetical protein